MFALHCRNNIVPNWWCYHNPTSCRYTVITCCLGVIRLWRVHERYIAKSDFPRFPDVGGYDGYEDYGTGTLRYHATMGTMGFICLLCVAAYYVMLWPWRKSGDADERRDYAEHPQYVSISMTGRGMYRMEGMVVPGTKNLAYDLKATCFNEMTSGCRASESRAISPACFQLRRTAMLALMTRSIIT